MTRMGAADAVAPAISGKAKEGYEAGGGLALPFLPVRTSVLPFGAVTAEQVFTAILLEICRGTYCSSWLPRFAALCIGIHYWLQ